MDRREQKLHQSQSENQRRRAADVWWENVEAVRKKKCICIKICLKIVFTSTTFNSLSQRLKKPENIHVCEAKI